MRVHRLIAAGVWCLASVQGQTDITKTQSLIDRYYQAIRNDDLGALKKLATSADLNARDPRGATPLMYAAAFGNAGQVKLLLEAGADVNARNAFNATALIWAGGDAVKSRMLIEHGADVNVRTQQGRTPLMMAAKRHGNADLVRLLLAKGADPRAAGDTTLLPAAQSGDIEIMRMLIEKGSDVNAISPRWGETPLHNAVVSGNVEAVRLLLAKGAGINAGLRTGMTAVRGGASVETGIGKATPLMWASPSGSPEMIRALMEAGANVNAQDIRGMSPLMLAVASETQDLKVVNLLLRAGANVNAHSARGETALDWAKKFGSRPVISMLQEAGAKEGVPYRPPPAPERNTTRDAATAVERGIALLERSSAEFFKQSGCSGCHHQDATAFAVRAARSAGIPLEEAAARERVNVMKSMLASAQELQLQGVIEGSNIQANHLRGLWAAGYPPDIITDSAVASLVPRQYSDGHWPETTGFVRSPSSEGAIGITADAVLALQAYRIPARQTEFRERIARASEWLHKAKPRSTDQKALLLLAVSAAGARKERVKIWQIRCSRATRRWWMGRQPESLERCAFYREGPLRASGGRVHHRRRSGASSRRTVSAEDPVSRRLMARAEPRGWIPAVFPERLSFRTRPMDFGRGTAWAAEAIARSIQSSASVSGVH